jgi:hypothetical protein
VGERRADERDVQCTREKWFVAEFVDMTRTADEQATILESNDASSQDARAHRLRR